MDAAPGDGVCRASAGACTLRAAIQEANALADPEAIIVPVGVYRLTLAEPSDGGIAGGDLNIEGPARITGAGASRTVVDPGRRSRILAIANFIGGRVVVEDITMRSGLVNDALDGGVFVANQAVLRRVVVRDDVGGAGIGGDGIDNFDLLRLGGVS